MDTMTDDELGQLKIRQATAAAYARHQRMDVVPSEPAPARDEQAARDRMRRNTDAQWCRYTRAK